MNDATLEKIFGRNYRILQVFLADPDKEFYVTEAANELNISKMSVFRILEKMVECGFLESRSDNYRKFYKLKDSHLIKFLKILVNLDSPIVIEFLRKFKSRSSLIMLYGSRAEGIDLKDSDWDFIVVSDELDLVIINKNISNLERRFATQINVKLYTEEEYSEMKDKRAPFYQEIMTNKILLKGENDEA